MFKTLTLLRRRPDLTMEQFMERYETGHAKLGERLFRGRAIHYERRFIRALPHRETGEFPASSFDVALEIWYPDRAAFDAAMEAFIDPAVNAEIAADEETLFDRSERMRFFVLEECASDLSGD